MAHRLGVILRVKAGGQNKNKFSRAKADRGPATPWIHSLRIPLRGPRVPQMPRPDRKRVETGAGSIFLTPRQFAVEGGHTDAQGFGGFLLVATRQGERPVQIAKFLIPEKVFQRTHRCG